MIFESKACNSEIRNRTRKTETINVRPGVVKVEKSRLKNETRKVKPEKRARRSLNRKKQNKKKNNFIQARILASEEG